MRGDWIVALWGLVGLAATYSTGSQQLFRYLQGLPDHDPAIIARENVESAATEHHFLNKDTTKFAVDGKSIPEVDFDLGESYAGNLPISNRTKETDNLFFWFFPTVDEESKKRKEITIWLNGGPGCSSLSGLLTENGPFVWPPGTRKPVKNPWSWHLLTNMVWIDQPVTVGYSTGNVTIKDDDDLAKQFMGFWKNFVKTFALQGYKVYIAAESYGGYYAPYIASHFLNADDTANYDMKGMMIFDGTMFDPMVQFNIPVPSYVDTNRNLFGFSDNVMSNLSAAADRCGYKEYLEKYLTFPPAGPQPEVPPGVNLYPNGSYFDGITPNYKYPECAMQDYVFSQWALQNPCFSVYSANDRCPQPYSALGSPNGGPDEATYFDRADVKKALHAPPVKWILCKQSVYAVPVDLSPPAGVHTLPHVIEKTNNVILVQGSMDALIPTNGVLLGIQNMTWNGAMGFHSRLQDPFYVPRYGFVQDQMPPTYYGHELPASSGVVGTTHHERGLTFVVTQLAGHMGPQAAPSAAFRQLEKLLGRVSSLKDTTPFTLPALRKVPQDSVPGGGSVHIPCLKAGC